MQLRLVTEPEQLAAMRAAWERFRQRCSPPCVFHSHEWFDAAWQWRRLDSELYVLCCERGGEIVGALPLVRRREAAHGMRWQALEFLAVPDTQRCDVLAIDDERDAIVAALADELRRRQADWDVMRLRYLPSGAAALETLAPRLGERRFRVDAAAAAANPWIALGNDWDRYYGSRSRRLKKAVNLAANRLAKAGRIDIRWLEPQTGDAADVERAVDDASQISARSWKTRTGNSLDNAGPQAFIRRLARNAHARGWLSIWTLSLDGRPTAMEIQLVGDGDVFALRSDFDAAMDECSPGSHLNRQMLESLFARDLSRYYMGPGDNAYKYRWAEGADPVHSMNVYGRSWRGRALAAWELALKPVARAVRDRLRARRAVAAAPDKSQGADA